jgi:hypothetical protein
MSSVDEMTIGGAMGLLATRLPAGVSACEYQLAFDSDTSMPVVRVAMILSFATWDDDAIRACERATTAAWEVLSSYGYVPDVICRTAIEHDSARGAERWERAGGDC